MRSLSNTWRFHPPATIITPPKHIILVLLCMGAWCDRTFKAILLSGTFVYSGGYRLLFKMGWSHPVKWSAGKASCWLHQDLSHL